MQSLTTHYQQLLRLPSTWKVEDVNLSMTGMQVVIRLVSIGKNIECPECDETCGIYDHAPEQKWRHLDTMQFETILISRLLRTTCESRAKEATEQLLTSLVEEQRTHVQSVAVDKVRRQESRNLHTLGDRTLIGSRYSWLRNPENMTQSQRTSLDEVLACELKTGAAWSLKNMFRAFWELTNRDSADYFFSFWSDAVDRSE